jgi:DNA mismatch repair ATPase MutS
VSTLFLLDELLGGINSADRLMRAKAILDELMAAGAVGLVTTHDLALADLAAMIPDRATNVHSKSTTRTARCPFDYALRPGVLKRTNARNIVAALGLVVVLKIGD